MRLVFGQDDLVADWVGVNLGTVIVPPYTTIGGTIDGKSMVIGAVFNQWNGSNLEVTVYGPGGLTRGNIRAICHYAFVQLGAHRLSATTRRSNKTMKQLLPRLGFKFEGTSERFYGPSKQDDAFRFVLFQDAAERWLR